MSVTEHGPGEQFAQAEIPRKDGFTEPSFLIDEGAAPETIVTLLEFRIQFNADPQRSLADLQRFKANPTVPHATTSVESPEPDKIWHDLTDHSRETSSSFDFDPATRSVIRQDRVCQRLLRETDPAAGVRLRVRRLEIFLERLALAQGLGKTSIESAE